LFGLALYGLLRARRTGRQRGALLDAIMLGSGALLTVHNLLIEPTMGREESWVFARVAIAIYPATSVCLIVIAARLAFGGNDRSVAFRLLLAGTTCLLLGDMIFALGEAGTLSLPQAMLEVPYLLVPAFVGSAVLHPSIRLIASPHRGASSMMSRSRLAAVAAALLTPIAFIAERDLRSGQTVTTGLCLILALTAIVRLSTAMKHQASAEALLVHQAYHDELTGLPSRSLIMSKIDEMLDRSRDGGGPIALIFLDLDHFKLVNDSMGHAVGDQLLVHAGRKIRSCLRPEDVVGRISGDEFIVVAHGLDNTRAHNLAERIRAVLGEGFNLEAGEMFISASVGITIARGTDYADAATLIQEADTAMYRSKEAGRNTVTTFDSTMRERVARRVELERRLRHALHEGELSAHYQPIVAMPSGRIHGFEALVRWEDGGCMLSPAEFIPVAEDSGLIVPLGTFMLDTACRELARWRRTVRGAELLTMSVNISPRQVRESDIVDTVAEALERYGLPGSALWLEITESVMMEDSVGTAAVMAGVRALGVRLAVDDFGTGFSSLSYLKRFPVSRVKIDRSFVVGLSKDSTDASLVTAIIAMASALHLEPVAEGVETAEQASRLYELGCRQAQGHLYERAVAADNVPQLIHRLGIAGTPRAPTARNCAPTRRRLSG
jgi:diguanylate cyclase (GGDEF)-like protein